MDSPSEFSQRRRSQRTTANAVRRSNAATLSSSGPSVMVRQLDGSIRHWNPSAEKTYGWSPDQAVGAVSHSLLKTQFPCSLRKINHQLLRKGFWEGELVHTLKNGAQVRVHSRWELQTDHTGSSITVYEINSGVVPVASSISGSFMPSTAVPLLWYILRRERWWWLLPAILVVGFGVAIYKTASYPSFTLMSDHSKNATKDSRSH